MQAYALEDSPLQGGTDKAAGYVVMKEQDMEGQSGETMRLFIARSRRCTEQAAAQTSGEVASTDGLTGDITDPSWTVNWTGHKAREAFQGYDLFAHDH
jgi:hypothetical protein